MNLKAMPDDALARLRQSIVEEQEVREHGHRAEALIGKLKTLRITIEKLELQLKKSPSIVIKIASRISISNFQETFNDLLEDYK